LPSLVFIMRGSLPAFPGTRPTTVRDHLAMSAVQILIADDHELFRRTLRSFLESQPNWHVCGEAGDGIEAVEKAKHLRPHLVLMDINMPRMDGLEATRIIHRELPECSVIVVTQNHASVARQQAAAVKADGYVTKSDLAKDLPPTIEGLLANRKVAASLVAAEEPSAAPEWLRGGGALGHLVHEFDWSKTPLGAIEHWPQSLKTTVRLLLASRFAMWMSWGPDLTFLYNDAYARMTLGKKHPWALGKRSHEVWEEIWDDIGPRIQKVLQSGEATWDEALLLFLERSGYREETYHTFSYSPLAGDDGTTTGHLCVVSEETDRVIGERRLNTLRSLSAELAKTITEQDIFDCVSRCLGENQKDLPFTLMYLFGEGGKQASLACSTGVPAGHPAAPELLECESDPIWPVGELLLGKDSVIVEDLKTRFHSVPAGFWDRSPWRALMLPITIQAQGLPAAVIIAGLNPYRPLDVGYAGFISLVAGQIAASIANARAYDLERKRAQALADIDRAKTAFFSNVSHEFRTPLTLMLGPLHDLLAQSPGALPPAAREQIELAIRNGARLLRLVNTLLDFSRIEAGRAQAVFQATDLAGLTSELASVFRSATEKAGLRLTVQCSDLGEPVYVDREMWEKIVLNLISNAFKFTFEGEIAISMERAGNFAELRVRDTGVGIPPEAIPRLFERFHRVPNTRSRTYEGTGIGLALVQELVKLHGGFIRVESTLGKGSTFVVSVPFGQEQRASTPPEGARNLASTAVGAKPFVEEALRWLPDSARAEDNVLGDELLPAARPPAVPGGVRPRVLVADDNADMRQYLARLLGEYYEVEAVADGQAALDAVRERLPNLILSDIMMPSVDGFQLLEAIRADERTRTIPVVLLSARAGEESRVEGMEAGADDYLIKPFSSRELLARLSARLEIARLQGEGEQRYRGLAESLERQVHSRTKQLEQRTTELVKQSKDIRYLSAQLLQMQDEERRHIARELHDSAGQTLALLGMNLTELVQHAKAKDPDIALQAEASEELVRQLQKEIRTATYLLHPPLLDESGLSSALGWYIQGLKERTGLNIALEMSEDFGRIQPDIELAIFRLIQECLTNIHRHSGSKSATIRVARDAENVDVEVRDQGNGISPERLAEIQSGGAGVGIRGMRERVAQFAGTVRIHSDSSGTAICVTLPISHDAVREESAEPGSLLAAT
jgi:signal transduction histidine kinase